MAKGDCVLAKNRRLVTARAIVSFLMAAILTVGMVGCGGDRLETPQLSNTENTAKTKVAGQLSEVAPPKVLQQLSQSLEAYQPQVAILSPSNDETLQDTKVSVQFQVQDLPIFKDPDLGLGPHLHLILDNKPYQAVYDISQPLILEDLSPGTHTLRVFASRPWHESFKNEGAYAQTTFHIFTKSTDNNPDPAQPLLTYSRPTGSYGAEPIMLDFYLTNAPLHLVAQENPEDEIADWRIRATVNGESFILDRWQSIYLQGFKPGKNWVKLEFIDEQGNPLKNVFNETVRLINYEPKGKDTLSKLVRGDILAAAARGIVEQNYKLQPTPTETPSVTPEEEETPTTESEKPESPTTSTEAKQTDLPPVVAPSEEIPVVVPKKEEAKQTEIPPVVQPSEEIPVVVPEKSEPKAEPEKPVKPEVEASTPSEEATKEDGIQKVKAKFSNFFKRFQGSSETTSGETPVVVPDQSEPKAETEASTPTEEATKQDKPKFTNFLKRFQRSAKVEETSPQAPEEVKVPSSEPTVIPQQPAIKPEPEEATIPSQLPKEVEEPKPIIKPVPKEVEEPKPVIKPVPTEPLPSEKLKEEALKAAESSDTLKIAPESGETPKLELQPILETPSSPKISESVTEKVPAVSASETPEKANPQPAEVKAKSDVPAIEARP